MAIDTLRRQASEGPHAPSTSRERHGRLPRLPVDLREWLDVSGRLLAFAAFVVVVVAVAERHEPWFDEAQAWLLARDEPLWSLLAHQMRYEGSPALWHLLLVGPAKLGLPYQTITLISVAIAIAGASVIARWSPFPLVLTVGVLFSFVVGYQYAIVARSYVLLPLLLFVLAMIWERRHRRPWLFLAVLCLLANTSTHGFLVAGSILVVHLLHTFRPPDRVAVGKETIRAHLWGLGVYVLMCALLVVQLWTAPDQTIGSGFNVDPLNYALVAPAVLNSALTGNPLVSAVAILLSCWWLWRTRTLLLWALPTLALLTLAAVKYHNYWHDGIPFLVWVFALWVSMRQGPLRTRQPWLDTWARRGAYVGMALVLLVQTVWWWQTVQFDWRYPYSGSQELASWLERQDPHLEVAGIGYATLGALPYLDRNVYANNNGGRLPSYYHWSREPRLVDDIWSVWLERPDVIVWSVKSRKALQQPALPGYDRVAVFEGDLYWKNRAIERDAFYVFRLEP